MNNDELKPDDIQELALSVGDGETILVLKQLKSGKVIIPLLTYDKELTPGEARRAVIAMCRRMISQFSDS